jgi:hypothetical protein
MTALRSLVIFLAALTLLLFAGLSLAVGPGSAFEPETIQPQ